MAAAPAGLGAVGIGADDGVAQCVDDGGAKDGDAGEGAGEADDLRVEEHEKVFGA